MKIKTSELVGPALDWAVAKCEGWLWKTGVSTWFGNEPWLELLDHKNPHWGGPGVQRKQLWELSYSTDWAQGGPIIEREQMGLDQFKGQPCRAYIGTPAHYEFAHFAPEGRPLIAAMRCYVAYNLGEGIEIPNSPLTKL